MSPPTGEAINNPFLFPYSEVLSPLIVLVIVFVLCCFLLPSLRNELKRRFGIFGSWFLTNFLIAGIPFLLTFCPWLFNTNQGDFPVTSAYEAGLFASYGILLASVIEIMDAKRILGDDSQRGTYTKITWIIGFVVSTFYLLYGLHSEFEGFQSNLNIVLLNILSSIAILANIIFSIIVNFDLNAKIERFVVEVKTIQAMRSEGQI